MNAVQADRPKLASVEPSSPIPTQQRALDASLEDVSELVERLGQRLKTVLRAVPPDEPGNKGRPVGDSELHEDLIRLTEKAGHQAACLRDLLDRLTL